MAVSNLLVDQGCFNVAGPEQALEFREELFAVNRFSQESVNGKEY
jgi:hypothetical protein